MDSDPCACCSNRPDARGQRIPVVIKILEHCISHSYCLSSHPENLHLSDSDHLINSPKDSLVEAILESKESI